MEIWEIGSSAQGVADQLSDHDILFITDDADLVNRPDSIRTISEIHRKNTSQSLDIAVYTAADYSRLVTNGSLFSRHVVEDGQPIICSDNFINSLSVNIGPYAGFTSDILGFTTAYEEAIASLKTSDRTEEFDLSTLAMCLRNASILLLHFIGVNDFSRFSSSNSHLPIQHNIPDHFTRSLANHRSACERGIAHFEPVLNRDVNGRHFYLESGLKWIREVRSILSEEKIMDAYLKRIQVEREVIGAINVRFGLKSRLRSLSSKSIQRFSADLETSGVTSPLSTEVVQGVSLLGDLLRRFSSASLRGNTVNPPPLESEVLTKAKAIQSLVS